MVDDQVFIVRCWDDRSDQTTGSPVWRLRVEHTNCATERHFADLPALCDFIGEALQRAAMTKGSELH